MKNENEKNGELSIVLNLDENVYTENFAEYFAAYENYVRTYFERLGYNDINIKRYNGNLDGGQESITYYESEMNDYDLKLMNESLGDDLFEAYQNWHNLL